VTSFDNCPLVRAVVSIGVPRHTMVCRQIMFFWHLMVFLMKLGYNNHQGCLKVIVYPFKGTAKYFLSLRVPVNQKRLRNTELEGWVTAKALHELICQLRKNNACFRSGVSDMRPARCVCAARNIIKITLIIAKTTVFCSIKALLPSNCGPLRHFSSAAREPLFLLKCGPRMKLSLRPLF